MVLLNADADAKANAVADEMCNAQHIAFMELHVDMQMWIPCRYVKRKGNAMSDFVMTATTNMKQNAYSHFEFETIPKLKILVFKAIIQKAENKSKSN